MDALISSALEEICLRGPTGVTLPSLWPTLAPAPPSTPSLKSSLWTSLLSVPTLRFSLAAGSVSPRDPKIQRFEDAEKLNLRVVANEHLRDCFLGLYDIPSSDLPDNQRRALERIALARTNGITQSQLAKEFGMEGNNFFYIVRKLEARGLIVRQQAVVKTTEAGGSQWEMKNSSCVTTNLVYLYRYAKHLGVQQRFEINKEARASDILGIDEEADVGGDGFVESLKDDVLVKDYLPAMKAICDKLEEASNKVLVICDIKRDLGYSGRFGHRAWRNICHRLKDACLVEEFEARVNGKVERCLRLLKTISLNNFDSKNPGNGDDCNRKEVAKFGRRIQKTDQLVELAIDHQIYDMIDAEGTKGALLLEVCGKLGLDRKRNDSRLNSMFARFGMHKQEENHKRTEAYRVWTSRNCNPEASNAYMGNPNFLLTENKESTWNVGNVIVDAPDRPTEHGHSASEVDFFTPGKTNEKANESEISTSFIEHGEKNCMLPCHDYDPGLVDESKGPASNVNLDLVSMVMETDSTSEKNHPSTLRPYNSGSCQASPCMPLTADGALREQRILDRLQDEKFILRVELHRWLASLEKDKRTTLDRKTIDRILIRLQQQGRCKCVHLSVPVVTNCDRSRTAMVILHPSVQSLLPELSGEILDRLRSFEKHIRSLGSSRCKINEPVPVLDDVTRTQSPAALDDRTVKLEALRANGFVLAKMVRVKLLHRFLWTYISSLPDWDDAISFGAHTCSYKLFSLEAAKKAIPLELLLQIAGSTKKYDDMIEKCKRGLRLSDLPIEEYRCLMDTQTIGKLSLVVDILRRLKLIRLIHGEHSDNGVKVPHATFTHAMEIKPYIEEPPSVVEMFASRSVDLRPRIRHDFILSNIEAVDEYWKTLEYCYAASDPKAALHSFPGSAVPEAFHRRSWVSARVISADQRAELLKCIVKYNSNNKISYGECEKIAKDLNLTLQQVLSVYYDNRRQLSNSYQGSVKVNREHQHLKRKRLLSPKKMKKPMDLSSVKSVRAQSANEQSDEEGLTRVQECVDRSMEELGLSPPVEQDDYLPKYQEDDLPDNLPTDEEDADLETMEERESCGGEECYSSISRSGKRKPADPGRFLWTDEADRQLVMQYVRYRAAHGARYQRVDWTKLLDLPAPPKTCARRMASLNRNITFRKALMKLCTTLSQRYAKYLDKVHCSIRKREVLEQQFRNGAGNAEEAGFDEDKWDDFNDESVKEALEDVLQYKRMAKLGASKRTRSSPKISNTKNPLESELVMPGSCDEDVENLDWGKREDSARRSRSHHLHQKFTRLLNEGNHVTRQVHDSLAVSNAVELLKLVFLSTSTASELQNLLAETLRRYSEHDLFAAFSYLREKKIMIGGNGGPFVLSQEFLHSVCKSPFPANTGKRAIKFSRWLQETEKDLMEEGIHLTSDLECGDIFQLFALVSSGELSISPCVPEEGLGEAEDMRNMKRKADDDECCDVERPKKLKSLVDSELISRRKKGFPGIMVSLHRATISAIDSVNMFVDGSTSTGKCPFKGKVIAEEINNGASNHDQMPEIPTFSSIMPTAELSNISPWEAMAGYMSSLVTKPSYGKQTNLCNAELFRAVYTAVLKAGDQGLSMEEISEVVNMPGQNFCEQIVDVLLAFGRVLKVNAYDSVRIVDALYGSKYFLTSLVGCHQDVKVPSVAERSDDGHILSDSEKHEIIFSSSQRQAIRSEHDVHKVTILNCPDVVVPLSETQRGNSHEDLVQEKVFLPEPNEDSETQGHSSCKTHMPILPWVNGDGTINGVAYNGLVRRVMGTVMQNPGILEDEIIQRIGVLNPQSCRSLLDLMILDNHLIVRKMHQSITNGPPALLRTLLGNNFRDGKPVYRKHFFANAMSTAKL